MGLYLLCFYTILVNANVLVQRGYRRTVTLKQQVVLSYVQTVVAHEGNIQECQEYQIKLETHFFSTFLYLRSVLGGKSAAFGSDHHHHHLSLLSP